MIGQPMPHPHHTRRYYLVISTVIIAGVFLLIFLNEQGSDLSLTGAVVDFGHENVVDETANSNLNAEVKEEPIEHSKSGSNVGLTFAFDKVPVINKEVKVEFINLQFTDLNTAIKINGDKVEINNIDEVNLEIDGFDGSFILEDNELSLTGTTSRIELNGISLSSSNDDLEITFENLQYRILNIEKIKLDVLNFPNGVGSLAVEDKLTYALSEEGLTFYSFDGSIYIVEDNSTVLNLEGTGDGLLLNGDLMSLSIN